MKINFSDINEILIDEQKIENRITELADQITKYYADIDDDLVVIGVLNGSTIFMSDLIRKLDLQLKMDWISLSSYGSGTKSSGVVRVIKDINTDIKCKNVLIVEDILDSGLTLSWLVKNLQSRGAASVEIVTLLRKMFENHNSEQAKIGNLRDSRVTCKWVGFDIPNKFVVGFGLDYANRYRNLPFVGVLSESVY